VESLLKSDVRALLIYSEDDPMCRREHYDILKNGLAEQKNVHFMLVNNKAHNPNYTAEAVKLLGEFSKARAKFLRRKNVSAEEKARFTASFDWEGMTAQDSAVWDTIFAHLDS